MEETLYEMVARLKKEGEELMASVNHPGFSADMSEWPAFDHLPAKERTSRRRSQLTSSFISKQIDHGNIE